MEIFFLFFVIILLVFVVIQRIIDKNKEDFEQRDN